MVEYKQQHRDGKSPVRIWSLKNLLPIKNSKDRNIDTFFYFSLFFVFLFSSVSHPSLYTSSIDPSTHLNRYVLSPVAPALSASSGRVTNLSNGLVKDLIKALVKISRSVFSNSRKTIAFHSPVPPLFGRCHCLRGSLFPSTSIFRLFPPGHKRSSYRPRPLPQAIVSNHFLPATNETIQSLKSPR